MAIRNAAKAIIMKDNKVLLNKNLNTLGEVSHGLTNGVIYYDLPGGGQCQFETLQEAVKRECLEETGLTVIPQRLAAVYEEISLNEEFRIAYKDYAHRIYFIFICDPSEEPVQECTEKDLDMIGSEWVNINDLKNILLLPKIIQTNFDRIIHSDAVLYLGSGTI